MSEPSERAPALPGILLVDDNPDYAFLVGEALAEISSSRRLRFAETAESALELLESRARVPLFVLVDLDLPRMSGLELVRRIKTHPDLCWIPVHVFSGSDCREDIQAAYRAGTNGYILKPVLYDELVTILQHLERFWTRIARLPGMGRPGLYSSADHLQASRASEDPSAEEMIDWPGPGRGDEDEPLCPSGTMPFIVSPSKR